MTSNFGLWKEKADIAKELFKDMAGVTLIMFFRRQDYAYESIYRQAVKLNKISLTFREFFLTHQYSINYLNWYRNINFYRSSFPHADFIVKPYEMVACKPDFFREFLSILGVRNIPSDITASHDNVGVKGFSLELLRVANKNYSGKELAVIREFIIQNNDLLGARGLEFLFSFTNGERKRIVRKFHRSNKRLFKKFHIASLQEFTEWEKVLETDADL